MSLDHSALLRYQATAVETQIDLNRRSSTTLRMRPHGSGHSARLSSIKVPLPARPWETLCMAAKFGSTQSTR
jgi:hypothetical protein